MNFDRINTKKRKIKNGEYRKKLTHLYRSMHFTTKYGYLKYILLSHQFSPNNDKLLFGVSIGYE